MEDWCQTCCWWYVVVFVVDHSKVKMLIMFGVIPKNHGSPPRHFKTLLFLFTKQSWFIDFTLPMTNFSRHDLYRSSRHIVKKNDPFRCPCHRFVAPPSFYRGPCWWNHWTVRRRIRAKTFPYLQAFHVPLSDGCQPSGEKGVPEIPVCDTCGKACLKGEQTDGGCEHDVNFHPLLGMMSLPLVNFVQLDWSCHLVFVCFGLGVFPHVKTAPSMSVLVLVCYFCVCVPRILRWRAQLPFFGAEQAGAKTESWKQEPHFGVEKAPMTIKFTGLKRGTLNKNKW